MTPQDDPGPLSEELAQLFDERKADGSPRFKDADVKAARAIILIEIMRRGGYPELPKEAQAEAAKLLSDLGFEDKTAPKDVDVLVERYFKAQSVGPAIFRAMEKIIARHKKLGDHVEAVDPNSAAFRRLTDKDVERAPHVAEDAPEDATHAQTLAQNLGYKVRI